MIANNFYSAHLTRYSRFIKSVLDRFVAAIALILLAPVMGLIAIVIYFKMGSPIIFAQPRPGKDKRVFVLYKFKTMTDHLDSNGNLLPDAKRLTVLGRFLRQTSLDELPQLFNVLKGEMSFVGPRPLLVEYLSRYTSEQAKRHNVMPGITGWTQVNGRNSLNWEQKFVLDVWYVDNWSLWLDLKIIFITVWKVLKKEGISHPNHATAEDFKG